MLGREQLTWLKEKLAASDAKWKVIVSSVPMSVPTGFPAANGRDGWANYDQNTGYEHELLEILRFMQSHGINNTTWITTDVHFGEAFVYHPFANVPEDDPNHDPDFTVNELITGPMNSGIFPTPNFDTTLNPERLAFFAPNPAPTTWAVAKHFFNFGELDVTRAGSLTMRIINSEGEIEFERTLEPP
jgi:alkaline phosphatase D